MEKTYSHIASVKNKVGTHREGHAQGHWAFPVVLFPSNLQQVTSETLFRRPTVAHNDLLDRVAFP